MINKIDKINKLCNWESKDIPLAALISIMYRSNRVYLNHYIEDMQINAGQFPILIELLKIENISQDELANRLCIDKGTIARSLRKMEDVGLIQREISPENRRKYNISLTNKGKELAIKIKARNTKWEKSLYKELNLINENEFKDILKNLSIKALKLSKNE